MIKYIGRNVKASQRKISSLFCSFFLHSCNKHMYLLKKTIIKFFVIFWRIHIPIDESHFIETSLNFNWLLHFWATYKDFEKWVTTTMTRLFIFKLQSKNYRSGRVEADWTKNWENEKITFFTFCLIPSISLSFSFSFSLPLSLTFSTHMHCVCLWRRRRTSVEQELSLFLPSRRWFIFVQVCVWVCVL